MRVVRAFFALVLALLWMPMTVHCGLESAGWWEFSSHACCDDDGSASREACSIVEQGNYTAPGLAIKVPPPAAFDLACVHRVWPVVVLAAAPGDARPPAFESPRDWISAWHFVRRAAQPARAPALNV